MSECDLVSLTLVCVGCGARRQIRIPRQRGIAAGWYRWLCLDCQGRWPVAAGREWSREPWKQEDI